MKFFPAAFPENHAGSVRRDIESTGEDNHSRRQGSRQGRRTKVISS